MNDTILVFWTVHNGGRCIKLYYLRRFYTQKRIAKHLGKHAIMAKLMLVNLPHSCNRTQPASIAKFWNVSLPKFGQTHPSFTRKI